MTQAKKLTKEQYLQKCIELLEFFGKDLSKDTIKIHSGDLSIIANPKFEFYKLFGGQCVWNIAEYVAKELNKEIEWVD